MAATWRYKVGVLVGAAVLVFAVALVFEDRLGPIDPTSPGWRTIVLNDMNRPIHVRRAGDDYNPLLPPARSDIFYGGSGQLDLLLVVADGQDQTLGCIPVKLEKRTDVTVSASSIGPCE
jgi:hypothetical protein